MNLKIAKPVKHNISEKELQKLFEDNLDSISDWGLNYVTSYLPIGTGIIDILAIDDEDNPVIIECKKIGERFDRDALIQLMRYYGWFAKDQNHMLLLHNIIKKKFPEKTELGDSLYLVALVSDIEDDIKEACWSIGTNVMLVTYDISEDSNGNFLVIPKIILDTTESVEHKIKEPKTESAHFKGRENMKPLYDALINKMKTELSPNIQVNTAPQYYIGISNKKIFCGIKVRKQWLKLNLLLSQNDVNNYADFTSYNDDWGHIGNI